MDFGQTHWIVRLTILALLSCCGVPVDDLKPPHPVAKVAPASIMTPRQAVIQRPRATSLFLITISGARSTGSSTNEVVALVTVSAKITVT